jgi:hypothetical protein
MLLDEVIEVEKRWDTMLDTANVTQQFIQTLMDIIGRKTSQEYAAVTIRNLLKKFQPIYPFLQDIKIKNTYSLELESCVAVQDSLNATDPKKVGMALKDLMKIIMSSMGKTAGYYFIRETREKIGIDCDTMLMKTMDVDLTMLQSYYIVEKKSVAFLHIEKSDVIRRFLKTMIEVVEKQTSKTYAIGFIAKHVNLLKQQYAFLENILINDIRYTLGSEEVVVPPEINNVGSRDLGKAILSILNDTERALTNLGRNSVINDLKTHLTAEYLKRLEEMGVTIIAQGIGYDAMFKQIIKALIDVIGETSTEYYAIFIVNSSLRKIDSTFQFLKNMKVDSAASEGELYHIMIANDINLISETDARHAIHQLLEAIMMYLGEKARDEFIRKFKDSLEKKYLSKIEEIGVNLYMIELHQEIGTKTEQKYHESKKPLVGIYL